jgi:ATP-dependent protease ClpP protease subunit
MLKRKNYLRGSIKCNEKNNDDELKDMIAENLLENLMGGTNKRHKHKHEEVYREFNHIYFKSDVTLETCDILTQLVREFEEEIKELKADPYSKYFTEPELYIHFTTFGGDLYASFSVFDTLKSKLYKVITIAEGYVASAGTVMMLGGQNRKIQKNAVMLIHQLSTGMEGKFEELKEDFFNSQQSMKRLINIYHTELHGKMTKKQIEEALKHYYWWDSKTCVQKGLCDEII